MMNADSDKYQNPTAVPLTDHEREVLVILIEEAAEVIQAATKLIRFGKEHYEGCSYGDNQEVLGLEIGDLEVLIEMARDIDLIDSGVMMRGRIRKRNRLRRFMQTEKKE